MVSAAESASPTQQFFPSPAAKPPSEEGASSAAKGEDAGDGRERQPEDGRPRSRQTETDSQAADGGGLDAAAAATVAEGGQKEAKEGGGDGESKN